MIKIIKKSETLCLVDVEVRAVRVGGVTLFSLLHILGVVCDYPGSVRVSIDILEGEVRSQIRHMVLPLAAECHPLCSAKSAGGSYNHLPCFFF